MASSDMLTEKLILALNSAKDVIKSEDSQILKKLMNSLNNNKESFSDDFTIDEIKAAVEERQQERANEDEVILGVEPADRRILRNQQKKLPRNQQKKQRKMKIL